MRATLRALPLLLSALAGGCAPVDLLNATIPRGGVAITRDIAYGQGPRERLDIYRPKAGGAGRPVAVFFHGGGWRSGRKGDYLFVAAALARRGIVTVVPEYRLYPQARFPDFLRDCAGAVAWTLSHAAEYGGDAHRVSLVGHSAGAYNAAMLALDPALLRDAGASRARLAGMVGLAGPYDFLPITDPDVVPVFAGAGEDPASQPVSHADGRNPPLLLLSGDADRVVRPRNSLALASRVRQAGGAATLRIYRGIGHVGIVTAFAPLFRGRAPVLDDVAAFVAAHRAP